MIEIALIDDKSYGLRQIQEIHKHEECKITHFFTFKEFKKHNKKYDIIYLDYYLDKDGITGDIILDEVKKRAKKVIGFSSVEKYSKLLQEKGAADWMVKS